MNSAIRGEFDKIHGLLAYAAANGLGDAARFVELDLYGAGAARLAALGPFDRLLLDPPRDGAIEVVKGLPEDGPRLMEARREVLALLERHGSLSDPALGPLLDAAHRRFGTGAADPIPL